MTSPTPTLASVAAAILIMYRDLGGERAVVDAISRQNVLGRRLALLSQLAAGDTTLDRLTQEQAKLLQEALLDAVALQGATGGRASVFDSFAVHDPIRLGASRYRRAKLRETDNAQLDWHFQILVQAWASQQGMGPLRDLQDDPLFTGMSACDFSIARISGRTELLECTRVHSDVERNDRRLEAVIAKIIDRLPDKVEQLNATATELGASSCDQHLLIDISAYAGPTQSTMFGSVHVEVGGFDERDLAAITNAVTPHASGLARVTLCWHVPVRIDGDYRAIIQRSKILLGEGFDHLLDYAGWTVEAYPLGENQYREFRVSMVARSLDWIVASYNSLSSPETFYTVGPEERA